MIPHIPDHESNVDPLPIDPVDVWDNDIRVGIRKKLFIAHPGIIQNCGGETSSSSDDYFYDDMKHPIATHQMIPSEIVEHFCDDEPSSSSGDTPIGYYYDGCILPLAETEPANEKCVSLVDKRWFWFASDDGVEAPDTSEKVRSLLNRINNPISGNSYTIDIPAGSTRVVFAYPSDLRDVSKISYREMGGTEVKDTFNKTIIVVDGLNDRDMDIEYKVYTYIPSVPFNTDSTYIITI